MDHKGTDSIMTTDVMIAKIEVAYSRIKKSKY
jgi:hypothetical protein